jgi:hypothetical protein
MPDTIQLEEQSTGGGMDGTSHISPQPERQPLRPVPVLERRQVELERELARQRLERLQPFGCARNSLHFSPSPNFILVRGSFVSLGFSAAGRSSRRACGRSRPRESRGRYISYCREIWFPIAPRAGCARYPACGWPAARKEFFLHGAGILLSR